jgi:hyperosmotically inducible periplasmic protein
MRHISSPASGFFFATVLGAALLGQGCEERADPNPPPKAPAPDNTGVNARDRNSANPTPADQGESEADRHITAEIRKAVLAHDGLSVNAQNCKIITRNGAVTLRGPVGSQAERDTIEAKAKTVAGVTSVINELEITPR